MAKTRKYSSSKPLFHPFELAVCGYSGSGKTTLLSRLIQDHFQNRSIGYVKRDAHRFDMDREGKDTQRLYESGARAVFISDPEHHALITRGAGDFFNEKTVFTDCDWVLIEGFKDSACPKILMIDQDETILKDLKEGRFENVIALVGAESSSPESGLPYFQRDDLRSISQWITAYFEARVQTTGVSGLLLTGGQSRRMGTDKRALQYHGMSQLEYGYDLLAPHVDEVFISRRRDQEELPEEKGLPKIYDQLENVGPMAGILAALTEHPETAFLVLAVDMPFVDSATLNELLEQRERFKLGTAFIRAEGELPEPLCAIYEPRIRSRLLQALGAGVSCPRKVLINSNVKLVVAPRPETMGNVNTPEDAEEAAQSAGAGLQG